MNSYTINTDAVSSTIEAKDADEAARKFAADQGYQGVEDMDDLVETIEGMDGYITILEDDAAIVYRSKTAC